MGKQARLNAQRKRNKASNETESSLVESCSQLQQEIIRNDFERASFREVSILKIITELPFTICNEIFHAVNSREWQGDLIEIPGGQNMLNIVRNLFFSANHDSTIDNTIEAIAQVCSFRKKENIEVWCDIYSALQLDEVH